MIRTHGKTQYTTASVNDIKEGYAAIELYQTVDGDKKRVARVVFWDAAGQFFLENFHTELPLDIVEGLISEAKSTIKIR